ncbi:MAG: glycogen/starch synthase [candidate division KSB1 bacterium]
MKNKFKVYYVAAEVAPFAGNGRLAATAGALPKALKDMGHDIRMMMPNYRGVNERKYVLRDVIRLKDMPIDFNQQQVRASGKSAFLPDSKVQIYFLDYKPYFDRLSIYQDPKTKKAYADNGERFLFFAVGCLETLKLLHWQPDIIHCNDWQTALIPVLLRTVYQNDPFFKNIQVLLTVHNFAEQGDFPAEILAQGNIPGTQFYPGTEDHLNGKANFLKAGLLNSDLYNIAGEAYAKSVQQDVALTHGLANVLRARRKSVIGVSSGVDTMLWNPETSIHLEAHFNSTNFNSKLQGKKTFCEANALNFEEKTPLLVIPCKTNSSYTADEIEKVLPRLLNKNQIVLLGACEGKLQKTAAKFMKSHPGRFQHKTEFDEQFRHRLIAAADLFLLPVCDDSEPENYLQAMQYGTIPITLNHLSYSEAVIDYADKPNTATGFLFSTCKGETMAKVVESATAVFADKKNWAKLMKNAMKKDSSWNSAAEKYTRLYTQLVVNGKK